MCTLAFACRWSYSDRKWEKAGDALSDLVASQMEQVASFALVGGGWL